MDFPLVSVITPSFNQGCFLRETIESVLSQDYPNLEYIIMDGGSTDESLSIIAEYAHDPRLTWYSGPDGGQASAIEKGFQRSKGTILAWLNSDDFYMPHAISKAVAFLQSSKADFVYGDAVWVDQDSRLIRYALMPQFQDAIFKLRLGIQQPSSFWSRHIWEKAGGLNPDFHCLMDRDFFWRMSRITRPRHMDEYLSAARIYEDTKSARLWTTVGYAEVRRIEAAMQESLPLWLPFDLPNYQNYPKAVQLALKGIGGVYNTAVRWSTAPTYMWAQTWLYWVDFQKTQADQGRQLSWTRK